MPVIPATEPIVVVFAHTYTFALQAPYKKPFVAITPPEPDNWNDFGHNLSAILYVISEAPTAYQIKVMFQNGGRSSTRIIELLGDRPWREISEVQTPFCTLLSSMESYAGLVRDLGFALAVSALRRLGDAVVLKLEGADPARLALLDTEAFALAALRQNAAFTAYRRGGRYLRSVPLEEAEDAAVSFEMAGQIPGGQIVLIDFDFAADELFRDRVAVLIGRNGTGKTQLLVSLIDGLCAYFRESEPLAGFLPTPACNRLIVFSSVPSDPYPHSIPPWSGLDYQYFSMTGRGDVEADSITAAIVDSLRDDGRIRFQHADDTFGGGRIDLRRRVLEPLGIWDFIQLPLKLRERPYDIHPVRVRNDRPYFSLSSARTLNEQRSLILTNAIDGERAPLITDLFGNPRALSSGELAIFRFAAQAVGAVERGSLFLFDEPETHLHPNFVSDFMDMLQTLLDETKSAAIIATHSVYVVREVPRQRVRVLSMEAGTVEVGSPRLQTFGASIDAISQFVFQDTSISHRYQDILRRWLDTLGPDVTIERVIEQYGAQMNTETLAFVARLIRGRGLT